MRSYSYADGKWTPVKDTIPPTVREPHFMSGTEEQREQYKRYTEALKRLGFTTKTVTTRQSRLGYVTIRSRDHAKLTLERLQTETYDFLCELSLAGSYIRVWIEDLPTLNFFLTDIQAHQEPEKDESLSDFLQSESLREALFSIQYAMSEIAGGNLEVTLKAPKTKPSN